MRKRYILAVTLLLGFSLVLLSGCGDKNSASAPSSQAQSSTAPAKTNPNPDKLLQAGETASLDGIEVTLVNAYVPKNVSADGEYKYVVLRYKVKNSGTQALQWENKNIYWFDSTLGEKKGSIKNSGVKTAVAENGSISPGTTGEFESVYKVAMSLSSVEFRFYSSADSTFKTKWKLDIK